MKIRPNFVRVLAGILVSALATLPARAQDFPTRPITVVVPFSAGGPGDTTIRVISERMQESLGQPVVIENVAGAAGSIGTGRVARAAADGQTLILGYWGTHVANGAIYDLRYDVTDDFEPVAQLPGQPLMIVANKGVPADDLHGLIAWLKAKPDAATQGTGGPGSAPHVLGLLFQQKTDTHYRFVPYRGAAPVVRDLVAGHIDLAITAPVGAVPQMRAGTVKAFAVTAKSRVAIAPEVPTVDEAGVPGLYFSLWQGLWAPKGTPSEVIGKIEQAVMNALADPAVREKFVELGFNVPSQEEQTHAALGALQRAEITMWWPIIQAAGIKAD